MNNSSTHGTVLIHQPATKSVRQDTPLSKKLSKIAKILAIVAILLLVINFAPSVYYAINGGTDSNTKTLGKTTGDDFSDVLYGKDRDQYQPKLDSTLSKENRIVIASAGIDTNIHEATQDNYEEALQKGVWRVSDFGDPATRDRPVILAAHRFGYLKWSIPYRLKNSFFSLPKLDVGDTVEITWRQRNYIYEVYKEGEGEEIKDYSADLILYTCSDISSPERIFKYARLLEI